MSEILDYINSSINDYIDGVIDVDSFRVIFAGSYHYARSRANVEKDANALMDRIVGPVAEFSGGYRSESSLRLDLATIAGPLDALAFLGPARRPQKRSRNTVAKETLSAPWDDFRWKNHASSMSPLSSKRARFQRAI